MRVMPHNHALAARVSMAWTISMPLGLHVCVGASVVGPHRLLLRVMPHNHALAARVSTAWTISMSLGLHVCVGASVVGPHRLLLQLHIS